MLLLLADTSCEICMCFSRMGPCLLELAAWSLADASKGGRQLLVASRTEVQQLDAQTLPGHGDAVPMDLCCRTLVCVRPPRVII